MRISIDATALFKERSGVGQYLYHLVNGFGTVDTKNEYRLLYDSLAKSVPTKPSARHENFSYHRVSCPIKLLKLASGLGRWKLPAFSFLLGTADVFHWPNYLMIPSGQGKHVITICDLTFMLFPDQHPTSRVQAYSQGVARSVSRADAVVAISQQTKLDVIKHLGVPEEKIRVIYCAASSRFRPIQPSERRPVLSKYLLEDKGYLLFVGNIEPRKNLVRLLEAYSKLQKPGTRPYPLILAGGRGWRNADVYRKVEELSLQRDVKFLGYVPDEDLPALMSGAALFVYPSLYEGFGLPPLEAMACGTPVITSNSSSLPEVVGDAAVLVDPNDTDGLAEAMHRVLTGTELQEALVSKGFERAKRFSWEETARQMLNVYEETYAATWPK